jgi:predicted AlkP superfamily phosphohydrolase/phosphomutase
VLHIAIDACDPTTMVELAEAGACPTIQALLERGATADVIVPSGVFVGSIWASLSTGRRVASHGFYCWAEVDESYEVVDRPIAAVRGERYWERLAKEGRRAAIIDPPRAPLPEVAFEGVMVTQWGSHDRDGAPACFPADLLAELGADGPGHPLADAVPDGCAPPMAPCDHALRGGRRRSAVEEDALRARILDALERKDALSLAALRRGGWDLFATTIGEAHCVGHQLWHLHDPGHEWHDPVRAAEVGDPVSEVYRRIDRSVGEHLALAGDDTPVYVLLSHGMGPRVGAEHLLDEVLHRIAQRDVSSPARALLRKGLGRLPRPALGRLLHRRYRSTPVPDVGPALPARADRPCFAVPNGASVGAVRLNVRGREAAGTVAPDETTAMVDELRTALLELVDVDTGRPAVASVRSTDEVHDRSPGDRLPDLLVEWAGTRVIDRLWSTRVGLVSMRDPSWRAGDHHDRGLLIVKSPRVIRGSRPDPIDVIDIAPTICGSLGVALPEADGRPRADLCA